MTGGTQQAGEINRILATAAQQSGIAMGLGSQRAALEHSELAASFQVRRYAPDVLLLANLGAIQLNYGYGVDECRRAVEMIEADALILHLNALQEAVQPEGDTRWAGLLDKIEAVCRLLPVPVIAKEVGWGFSEQDARSLALAGVAAIDVAGAGGTSWSQVEMHRARSESQRRLAAAFVDWGIPTAQAILNVCRAAPELIVIASGGLRSGVDVAKCIALGARLGGMAGPFLKAAAHSLEDTLQMIEELNREIRVCMFMAGAGNLEALGEVNLATESPSTLR
jgi:isopentenyl-diphosphate delta-isomerase